MRFEVKHKFLSVLDNADQTLKVALCFICKVISTMKDSNFSNGLFACFKLLKKLLPVRTSR